MEKKFILTDKFVINSFGIKLFQIKCTKSFKYAQKGDFGGYVEKEGYTSKCDALAMEDICKHDSYLGKRIKRGLFKSAVGKVINADVNGALNIGRKVFGDSFMIADSGRWYRPERINVLKCV